MLALDELEGVVTGAIERRAVSGRLVVCPTPIGNLEDITLRVLRALREADVVACEDTRHTRMLLERHGIAAPLVSFHEHNERRRAARAGRADARRATSSRCVSDAGTPLVSDPGFVLVAGCVAAGLPSRCSRGRRAALAALVASARCPSDAWRFAGLPAAQGGRAAGRVARARRRSSRSSRRGGSRRSLRVLAALDPERPVAVCRELTKLHEEVVRGTARELAARYAARRRAARSCS